MLSPIGRSTPGLIIVLAALLAGCSQPDRPVDGGGSAPTAAAAAPAAVDAPGARVPFTTLEAEADGTLTNGTRRVMGVPVERSPESEASGYGYVQLERVGDHLEFPQVPAADALVIRHCIPDAPAGGGITATLGLYVNGVRRQSLSLSSRHNWLYGTGKPGENGQGNTPTAFPHVYWDETRVFISGGIRAGDRLRLQKDAGDEAAFYRIDLVDVELAGAPLAAPAGALAVTGFGADGGDGKPDTQAMRDCIAAARVQGRPVWIPPGRYLVDGSLRLDGVRVQGAGMWHSTLVFTEVPERWTGVFDLAGAGSAVADLAIDGPLVSRKGPLHGFTGFARDWQVRRVWISHTNTAFWVAGDDGVVSACRVRFTYADGININNGSRLTTHRVLVEDNHCRGCGDDSIAILCHQPAAGQKAEDRQTVQVTVRHNTAIAPWWASCCDLAGGEGHVIEDNLFEGAGLVINLPAAYPMQPQGAAVIRRNLLRRCGTGYQDQRRGALWIYAGSTTIDGVVVEDNRIVQPLFKGIDIQGSCPQAIVFRNNRIEAPGVEAVSIGAKAQGSGRFIANQVLDLPAGVTALVNRSASYAVVQEGNSWR